MWWRFRKHKLAMVSAVILILFYFSAVFSEFVAPYVPEQPFIRYKFAPPTRVHFIDAEGRLRAPFIYQTVRGIDPVTAQPTYTEDTTIRYPIRFFVQGEPYKWLGLIPSNLHLFGVPDAGENQGVFLFGADRLGDMFSRIILGSQISLTIGLVGVLMSLVFGTTLGIISGYYGGIVDELMQRLIELVRAFPDIPLWMALSAALPAGWSQLKTYFAVTLILSLIGWTWLARQLRGQVLALRQSDYVMAAKLAGASDARIIFRHLIPATFGQIIVVATLAMPAMIIAETALSFLGLGLRPPTTSWGVLLQESQNLQSLALYPWVFTPAIVIVIVILAFSFMGDGLRDAADPYTI